MKFKDRYVLGTGYPWAMGLGKPYVEIAMLKGKLLGFGFKPLKFPEILWNKDLPKYRLVLERVE